MKILVSSINFAPDHSGIALYSTDLPVFLVEKGHEVTVVTGFSYYPKWKKRPEDSRKLFAKEVFQGVKVLRGYLYIPKFVTTIKRILHEISFSFFAFLNFLRAGRQDCIIIISPPITLGLVGVFFRKIWRCQLITHIQDMPTEAARSLGMIKNISIIRTITHIENFIYRDSSWIATITNGMCQSLVRRGIEKDKLEIFYNWIDVKKASAPIPKGNFRSKFKHLNNKFLVAYAGNLGIKQGIDSLLKIAAELKNEPAIHFLIIGDGADKDRLIEISKDLSLINVTFISFLSQHEYFEMLEDLDISYVSQRSGTGNVFFPSKLLGIMAKSKPLLIAADPDSELFTFIQKNECGIITNFDDTKAQVEAVLKFYKNPNEIFKMGQNGFKSVLKYDRDIILNQFHNKIVKNQNPNIKP